MFVTHRGPQLAVDLLNICSRPFFIAADVQIDVVEVANRPSAMILEAVVKRRGAITEQVELTTSAC
jgi:hypothetical protein